MTIRKATPNDFSKIISIYAHAREQMRLSGNPNQWGSTNPSEETIKNDIKNGYSYVITDTDSPAIFGVFAFIIGKDPTYEYIENGSWLNDDLYGTIHRIAGSGEKKEFSAAALHSVNPKQQISASIPTRKTMLCSIFLQQTDFKNAAGFMWRIKVHASLIKKYCNIQLQPASMHCLIFSPYRLFELRVSMHTFLPSASRLT